MHSRSTLMFFAAALVLVGCNAPKAENDMVPVTVDTAAATTAPEPAYTGPEGAPEPTAHADAMAGMNADEQAASDAEAKAHGAAAMHDDSAAMASDHAMSSAASGLHAGWYTAGIFRACGSSDALKVDKRAEIDAKIRAAGMSTGDPVYVQLEGMPMGSTDFMATRVVQVGSKTPVRDCPMTGTTTQMGG